MADWRDELGRWLAPFVDRFGHKARRRMCPLYVAGLIGPGDRKSVGPMAERVAPGDYDRLHHFVADGVWDEAPLERELALQADKLVGGAVPVMVGLRLFLPETWTGDKARLERAGVPAECRSALAKSEIALAELDRLIGAGVRFGTVLADAGYGMGAEFRQALSARSLAWAVGIPRHQKVYPRDVELVFPIAGRGRPRKRHVPNVPSASAEDMLTQAKWRTLAWRKGTKGPLKARFAAVRVRVADGRAQRIGDKGMQHMPGEEVWLVGERRASGEQKYYLANLPAQAGLKTLAATIKARWVCEQAHQQLKEELGLDHFEGRSWRGLHRHALMAMIAYAFLQHLRLAAASGGKKNLGRPPSTDAAGDTKSHRRRPGPRSALPMPTLPPASPQTA